MSAGQREFPIPGWGHGSGYLAMRVPSHPEERSIAIERSLIVERVSRYGWSFDERQEELLSDCFTEDGVWEGTIAGGDDLGPFVGRDAIVEFMTDFWRTQRDQRRHMIVNTIIEEQSETTAVAQAYQILFAARGGQVALETTGFYRFDLRRSEEGWKISHLFSGYDAPFVPGKLDYLDEGGTGD